MLLFLEAFDGAIDANFFDCPADVLLDESLSLLLRALKVGVDLLGVFLETRNPEVLKVDALDYLILNSLLLLICTHLGHLFATIRNL